MAEPDIDAIVLLSQVAGEGNIDEVKRLIPLTGTNEFALWALPGAAKFGQIECMKILIDACTSTSVLMGSLNRSLVEAVRSQQIESLQFIFSVYEQHGHKTFDCGTALYEAAFKNDIDILKMLLPYCNSNVCGDSALHQAVCNDNMDAFVLLLPVSDPTCNDSPAFIAAVTHNRPKFFEILLPLSDVTGEDYIAFREAVHLGYVDFAKKMYPLVDVQTVEKIVIENQGWWGDLELTPEEFMQELLKIEADIQKDALHNSIAQHRSRNCVSSQSPEVKRKM